MNDNNSWLFFAYFYSTYTRYWLQVFFLYYRFMQEISQRKKFIDIFLEKNKEINLSAIRDADWVYIKHILDSLELNKIFPLVDWTNIIDVWTGGWFPLLPLAITHPHVHFTWLDSVRKKTEAVTDMAKKLWIKNVSMVWLRAEDFDWKFDILTARAMSYIDNLLLRCNHIVKKGWYFVFYKMHSEDEDKHVTQLCHTYRLTMKYKHIYTLFPWDIERVIYVLKKWDRLKDRWM